ncbi:MAG: hypothetical protein ABR929_04025 [Roseiarcus sp.]|jgi:hypothetical protein
MSAASLEGLRATRVRAWADPGGIAPVFDCVIVDVSEEGAAVALLDGAALPDKFCLQVDRTRPLGEAKWFGGRETPSA